jgi:hypothetical protein
MDICMFRVRVCAIGILMVCAAAAQRRVDRPSTLSMESPFAAECNGTQTGRLYRNAAVEPWIAVNPRNPLHVVGVWQQDRWSNGGASGLMAAASFDGGATWTRALPAFSRCSAETSAFQRASDPWVSISPDGTAHMMSLSLRGPDNTHAMLASRSRDGGQTWDEPVTLIADRGSDILNDKNSLTADPLDARYVYAVWDRLVGLTATNANNFRGPTWFARSTDGGASWEPARQIFDPGTNAQTIGNAIVALPDGTVVNGFTWIQNAAAPLVRDERLRVAILRSPDRGLTWSDPIVVAPMQPVGVSNVKTGVPVRSGAIVPALAADAVTGALYAVWEEGRFTAGKREGIAFSRSVDGGLNWSAPEQINQAPEVQAFTPAVAAHNGTVAVTYFDFRKDTDDRARLMTTCWRILSTDGGRSWTEEAISQPFDLTVAPVTDGSGYFIGDYHGLSAAGGRFLAFFATTSGLVMTSRASGIDRTSNGRVEINRHALRRRTHRK